MPSKVWDEITYPFSNFNGCNRWSLGMDQSFHPTLYNGCNYIAPQCYCRPINSCLKIAHVTHRGRMLHICVCKLGHRCFRLRVIICSKPNRYLNHCWFIINLTIEYKFESNYYQNELNKIQHVSFPEMNLKIPSVSWFSFYLGLSALAIQLNTREAITLVYNSLNTTKRECVFCEYLQVDHQDKFEK